MVALCHWVLYSVTGLRISWTLINGHPLKSVFLSTWCDEYLPLTEAKQQWSMLVLGWMPIWALGREWMYLTHCFMSAMAFNLRRNCSDDGFAGRTCRLKNLFGLVSLWGMPVSRELDCTLYSWAGSNSAFIPLVKEILHWV